MFIYTKSKFSLLLFWMSLSVHSQDIKRDDFNDIVPVDSLLVYSKVFYQTKEPLNPAYLNERKERGPATYIETFYTTQSQDALYPILNGKELLTYGIKANWFTRIDSTSNFRGIIQVSKGNQKDVYANTMRLSTDYGPYGMINLKASDFKFQHYHLQGTYNKQLASTTIGGHLYYVGDYAYKQTDPRARAIAGWFGGQLGVKQDIANQHQLGVSVGYELHNQNVELDVWKGNIKQQFFLLRGFGMYDHDHKDFVFSKKRLYKQNDLQLNLNASLWRTKKVGVDLTLQGLIRKLKTEEESTINLYELTTKKFLFTAVFNYTISDVWQTQVTLFNRVKTQDGRENRYSYIRVNEDYLGVYDYVQIGSIDPYSFKEHRVGLAWNWSYLPNKRWLYQFSVQYEKNKEEERYTSTLFQTDLERNSPKIQFNVHYFNQRHQFLFSTSLEQQRISKANTTEDTSVQSLYQELYYPTFLYHSLDKNSSSVSLDYSYKIREKERLGTKIRASKLWGNQTKLDVQDKVKVDAFFLSIQVYYQF